MIKILVGKCDREENKPDSTLLVSRGVIFQLRRHSRFYCRYSLLQCHIVIKSYIKTY